MHSNQIQIAMIKILPDPGLLEVIYHGLTINLFLRINMVILQWQLLLFMKVSSKFLIDPLFRFASKFRFDLGIES